MRKITICLGVIAIIASVLAKNAHAQDDRAFARPYWLDRSVIEVVGRAQQEFMPDRAQFSVAFTETAREAIDAAAAAADRARLATAAIRRRGGEGVELTSNVQVNALYEEYRDREGVRQSTARADQVETYVANITLTVIIKNVARAADARAAALAVGPENTSPVSYWLQSIVEQQRRVYLAAVEDAGARARGSAAAADVRLGPLMALQEGQGPCMGQWRGAGYAPPLTSSPPAPHSASTDDDVVIVTGTRASSGRANELRLTQEQIERLALPTDIQPVTLSAHVCAVFAVAS